MINCAIYPRKSKASDNSQSMEQQVDDCRRYIADHYPGANITLYDADYGITGHSIIKRKDFQRMMADIRNGKVQLVVILRYDRIARNMRDFCNIYHDMEINGCNLVSVSQQIDTTTPYGKNFMYQMASMAELEWALTSERYKDMHRFKISHGLAYTGKLPRFGFRIKQTSSGKRIVHDREKETVDIFDHLLKVKSKNETVRYVRDMYDKDFTRRMLEAMINSDLYIGKVRENENYCEPYFANDYMQQIRSINCIKSAPTGNHYLFSGLLRCPICHRKLSANPDMKKGKLYIYYRCPGSIQNKHKHFAVSESKIELSIRNDLKAFLEDFNAKVVNISPSEKESAGRKIKRIEDTMQRLDHLFEIGRLDIEEYDKKISVFKTEIEDLRKKTSVPHPKAEKAVVAGWKIMYDSLDREKKMLFWQNIISEIEIDETHNVIFVNFK